MALPSRSFSGSSFFQSIRAAMDRNRAMFAGIDHGLAFVCMDASFYRMDLLIRPSAQNFTDAAVAQPPSVRAVANGQMFASYCYMGPCAVQWQGEIVARGVSQPGNPRTMPNFRQMGQWAGCSQVSYGVGRGDPSTAAPQYQAGMGRLIPLIEAGTPATAAQLGSWQGERATKGKSVYGLCRRQDIVFLVVQEDGNPGLTAPDLIARMASMGVEDALMGDGSDSAALIVDRTVEVQPGRVKNNSIPVGPMFRLHGFQLGGARTLRNDTPEAANATTDPGFQQLRRIMGTVGTIQATTSGAELVITDLGTPNQGTALDLQLALGVMPPLRLELSSSAITAGVDLSGPGVEGRLTLAPAQNTDGRVTGHLVFTTERGAARFDFDWPVQDHL